MKTGSKTMSLLAAAVLCAAASHVRAQAPDARFLHFGDETQAPNGYVELCQTMASICRSFGDANRPAPPDRTTVPGGAYCPEFSCLLSAPAASVMVQSDPFISIAALPAAPRAGHGFTQMPLFRAPEVDTNPPAPPIPVDGRQMGNLIAKINARVNHRVHQALDMRTYGRDDVWRPSGTGAGAVGDCEDLALEKRLQLIAAGFPPERLFMAIVFRPEVGLHAVLVARLPDGDRVLDSRVDYIQRWSRTGYAWLNLEQPGTPERWSLPA